MPRYLRADYDQVWNAVIDVLDDRGYVIAQMDKQGGYISTHIKESTRSRRKLSIRFAREDGAIRVTVRDYSESRESLVSSIKTSYYWEKRVPSGSRQQCILDKIERKLTGKE